MEAIIVTSTGTAAASFARAEAAASDAVKFVAAALGSKPTYAAFEAVRKEFVPAYIAERKCDQAGGDKAWGRFALAMKAAYGVEKPKAPTADATRKTAEREKAAKAVAAIVKAHKGDVQKIRAAVPANASPAVVKQYADAMMQADKAKQADAKAKATKLADALKKRIPTFSVEQLESLSRAADLIAAGKKLVFQS